MMRHLTRSLVTRTLVTRSRPAGSWLGLSRRRVAGLAGQGPGDAGRPTPRPAADQGPAPRNQLGRRQRARAAVRWLVTTPGGRTVLGCGSAVATVVAAIVVASVAAPPADRGARSAPAAEAPAETVTARVEVDAAANLGVLNNPANYQNQADHSRALGPRDVERAAALRPTVMRAWVTPRGYYNVDTGQYTFDYVAPSGNSLYDYLDQVTGHGGELMLNIDQCPRKLMTLDSPHTCREVLRAGIRHYKLRYPTLSYIELFNEPDKTWAVSPEDSQPLSVEEYYAWFSIAYRVINEINRELDPEIPLKLGGPVTYTFNRSYIEQFIELYSRDPNPAKRLDFISYHQYQARENPASVATEKAAVADWLRDRGLDPALPVFVTEYGVFPGDNAGTTFAADRLTQAAAMATLGYYYIEGGLDMPMHWVFDHPTNDRKSMFVDGVDGAVTPYYNMVLMQRMLGRDRLRAHSTALSAEGIGVNALASADPDRIAVLVTNYQWTTGVATHRVGLSVDNVPFADRPIVVTRYHVDSRTSNYDHDPEQADLQVVEQYTVDPTDTAEITFVLEPNAISLVELTAGPAR